MHDIICVLSTNKNDEDEECFAWFLDLFNPCELSMDPIVKFEFGHHPVTPKNLWNRNFALVTQTPHMMHTII